MAEGLLRSFDQNLEVHSAGTNPSGAVHPRAIRVMSEIGIDISNHSPKNADKFLNESFDYVITVCDHAKETCPVFVGHVKNRLHIGFRDPAEAVGSDNEITDTFRQVRDEIKEEFLKFHREIVKKGKI